MPQAAAWRLVPRRAAGAAPRAVPRAGVPELSPILLVFPALGLVAGFLAGLLGIGTGFLTIPVMAWAFARLDPASAPLALHVAIGTSMATILPTSIASARTHWKEGGLDWAALRLWAPFVVLGALGGGTLAEQFDGRSLTITFGALIGLFALNMGLPNGLPVLRRPPTGPIATRATAWVAGIVSALLGIGGAVISVPALRAGGMAMHRAVGTGAAIGFLIALPGTVGHVAAGWGEPGRPPFSLGYVSWGAALLLVPFTVATAPFGARVAHRTNAERLRRIFAAFLGLVSFRMLWSGLA